jgi:hypothetical protein
MLFVRETDMTDIPITKINRESFLGEAEKNVAPDVAESLKVGETGWLRGYPVKSEPGTIALKTRDGLLIIISEADAVGYARHEHEFFVHVKNGSDVITRFESVNKLLPSKPSLPCDCSGSSSRVLRQQQTGGGPPDEPLIDIGCYSCWIEYVEAWCELPGGILFKCYRPQIRCGDMCPTV